MKVHNFPVQENDNGFKFVSIRHNVHDYRQLKIWVNNRIHMTPTEIEGKFVLEFPIEKAEITKTQKGLFVLRPAKGNVFFHSIGSGYRGSANLECGKNCEEVTKIWSLASGRGALGEICLGFYNSKFKNCEIKWYRSGRRVDQTEGVVCLTLDGKIREIVDPEVDELLV